jgi:hypothetical protein
MNHAFLGAALAVGLIGSAVAYAAETPAAGSGTPAPAATDTPTPPASLHCKAPKVPKQVKNKAGKLVWKCVAPAAMQSQPTTGTLGSHPTTGTLGSHQ